jgi:Ca-activated chloride channel homolog
VLGETRIQSVVRGFLSCGLACIVFSSFWTVVSGQQERSTSGTATVEYQPVSPSVHRTDTTIRVHSDLVLIPATVTDRSGKAVAGLEKEHFTLFEDGVQQEITHFGAEDAPVSIGVVFDASDSMAPKLRRAREAVNALLSSINPNSESFLVKFSTTAQLTVPLTSQLEEIRNSVEAIGTGGTTALLDGVHLAMTEMTRARYARKAIVIISDGEDNASHWTVNELKAAVGEQDILIYAIAIADWAESYPASRQQTGTALLKEVAGSTGGCMFLLNKLQQLPGIADKIGGWLRNQYVLGYVPSRSAMDGTYRKVELKVTRPKGFPRLEAGWRKGYYAPKD